MSWWRFQSECRFALRPTGFRQATGGFCRTAPLLAKDERGDNVLDGRRVEQLKQHWIDGKSASQIASLLGNGVTRNAVIGKVHRLGLAGRAKSPGLASSRPRRSAPPPAAHRVAGPRLAPRPLG